MKDLPVEPNKDLVEELSDYLGIKLADRLTEWLRGKDLTFSSWQRVMIEELRQPLVDYLVGPYSRSLKLRGIEPLGVREAEGYVDKALFDVRDIYATVISAPVRVEAVTAAFFVDTLLRRVHQSKVVSSILHRVRDLFGNEAVEQTMEIEPGFTGRKMWRVNVVSSRHKHLHGQVRDKDGLFEVSPGNYWPGPRSNIFAVAQSSNCRCELVFEYVDKDGLVTWR